VLLPGIVWSFLENVAAKNLGRFSPACGTTFQRADSWI
jgi:hypothetical protein